MNRGGSGRLWGSIFFVDPLFYSPSLETIFVFLLSSKSRYVDTIAVALGIRKTKMGDGPDVSAAYGKCSLNNYESV